MAYIGPAPNPGQNREVDDISSGFNGSEVNFTLQVNSQNVSPGSANAIIVSLGGVIQNPGTDYTVAASTITFTTNPASGLSFFGLVLGQSVDTEGTADNSITTAKIVDEAVTLAKLPHGTGSTDGKFLRANNGADPTFESLPSSGATLSGSTNNTVVTVTGANAMQGEANLTFDGTDFDVASGNSSIKITTSSNTPKIHFNANSVTDAGKIQLSESSGGGVMIFSTADTGGTLNEAMRISTTGQVLVGNSTQNASPFTTSTAFNVQRNNDNVASFYHAGTNFNPVLIIRHQRSGSSGNSAVNIQFNNTNGFQCGSISSTLTATSYNTSSDYRLKENAVSISDGITRLKTLKPYRFNFKVEASKTLDGFFAHEVTAVPEAISGTKDATENCSNVVLDKDGNFLEKNVTEDQWNSGKAQEPAIYPTDSTWSASYTKDVYQEIDQAKLVPLLTAALQEAITKIETLETKVAALEAA